MKDSLLGFFQAQPDRKYSLRQVVAALKVPKHLGKKIEKQLGELIDAGKVAIDNRGHYTLREEPRALKGVLRINPRGFGFVQPEAKGKADVFIPNRQLNYAMDGDTVLVESFRNPRDGRFEGRVIQVVEHANPVLIGTVVREGKQTFVRHQDGETVMEILVQPAHLGGANVGDYVAVRIIQYPGQDIVGVGEIIRVMGDDLNLDNFADTILLKYGIRREFPADVRLELSKMDAEVDPAASGEKRVDLSKLPIITIDGITAKDFDDAVYVEKRGDAYTLYVCIADVSYYVPVGSPLDQEAYRRGTSIYLPREAVPMLPHRLSDDLCSLRPHVPRLTLTAEMKFNAAGEFVSARFYESWIRSAKRATYEEVQTFLDGNDGDIFAPEVKRSIRLMHELAEKMLIQREKRGALGFDLPEAQLIFDGQGKIERVQRSSRFFSHRLIEEFMIAANVAVAAYFTTHGLPLLYRVHDAPDPLKIKSFQETAVNLGFHRELKNFDPAVFFERIQGHPMEFFLQTSFLRSLKQAVYDPDNRGHFGLMLEDYCHFTSPIRRYPDLIVHRQLRALFQSSRDGIAMLKASELGGLHKPRPVQLTYHFNDLKSIGRQSSQREREAMELERETLDVHKAFFMREHLNEEFCGRITRIARFGLFVELDPHFVEGVLGLGALKDDYYDFDEKRMRMIGKRKRKIYAIGDRVWVRVTDIKIETGQILLSLAEKPAQAQARPGPRPGKRKKHSNSKNANPAKKITAV
jgi:ribonuclease R